MNYILIGIIVVLVIALAVVTVMLYRKDKNGTLQSSGMPDLSPRSRCGRGYMVQCVKQPGYDDGGARR